jgi:cytochrome d ubiquinol oxidase subunit II
VPALVWGVAFANIVRGVPLDDRHEYVGTLGDLLNPYALVGGLTTLTLFATHGAVFLALKTTGEISRRAAAVARRAGVAAAVLLAVFLVWTQVEGGELGTVILVAFAVLSCACALGALAKDRQGWAFLLSTVAVGVTVITLFAVLYPNVLPSTIDPAYSLNVENAAATPKTLGIMTWVAVIFLPLVLLYQSWTYWVFRRRISVS